MRRKREGGRGENREEGRKEGKVKVVEEGETEECVSRARVGPIVAFDWSPFAGSRFRTALNRVGPQLANRIGPCTASRFTSIIYSTG